MADAQPNPYSLSKRCAAEFVGTFFLVLTIGLAIRPPLPLGSLTPIPIAAILIAMIYACAHISGAHFNPAVAIALAILGIVNPASLWIYALACFSAAATAAALFRWLEPREP